MPSAPNLFAFATSELTQDAVFCWLLAWADESHASTDPTAHRMGTAFLGCLFQAAGLPPPPAGAVRVTRQSEHVDIVATVGTRFAVAIEDKVHTSEHSDQLRKYATRLRAKHKERTLVLIYLKTGEQCSYDDVREAGWTPLTRKQLLSVLRPLKQSVSNSIFVDFLGHLEALDAHIESYRGIAPALWGTSDQWKGFYDALQPALGDGEWGYVPTPSGGFMGYWWGWTRIYGGQLYLQLQESSLVVKVMVHKDDAGARRSLRDRWVGRVVGCLDGLCFDRPTRLGHGKTMTVAEYHGDYRAVGHDGLIDLDTTVKLLERATRAVRSLAQGREDMTPCGPLSDDHA